VSVLNTRSIVALDAETGRMRWEYEETYPGYKDVPSYSDGRLILWERTRKPRVLALEAATGKALWHYAMEETAHLPVLTRTGLPVDQGRVFLCEGTEETRVVALDERTGKPLWRSGLGKDDGEFATPPSAGGGLVFVALRSSGEPGRGAVVALDAVTGREAWRRKETPARRPDRMAAGYPPCTDGRVVACGLEVGGKAKVHLLDARTGQTLWVAPNEFRSTGPPAVTLTRDYVLLKPYGGQFFIHDRKTGERLRDFNGKTGSGCSTPSAAGSYAFLGTGVFSGDRESLRAFDLTDAPRERGHGTSLYAVDLRTGQGVWYFGTGNTVCGDPALAYGRLYCTSRDGRVYCFAPAGPGEPTTPEARDRSPGAPPEQVRACLARGEAERPADGKAWPMAGGAPERAGLAGPPVRPPLRPAWTFRIGDRVLSSAAIRDGRVFVGSDAGTLVCLEADSGRLLWEIPAGGPVRSSPAAADGLVYAGSDDGTFTAIDAETGRPKWTFACGGPVQASPAVVGGAVLFGAHDHHVYALDRETGRKLWSFRMRDFSVQAPPVVHGERVFVGQWQDWVWALDLKTGRDLWRSFVPVSIEAVAFHRDRLYVRSPYYVLELDPASGKRLRVGVASYGTGGMAFKGDLLVQSGVRGQYGHSGATVTDLSQPGQALRTPPPSLEGVTTLVSRGLKGAPDLASMVTPLFLGEALLFAGRGGRLSLTDLEGTRLASVPLGGKCHSAPVAADGLIVLGCDDGRVVAFRGA
jgi:outer membrane protein assembly factor BamB